MTTRKPSYTTTRDATSPSVWRTLGNWSKAVQHSSLDLAILELFFVTNASVAEDSGLARLPGEEVDERTHALPLFNEQMVIAVHHEYDFAD